MSRRPAPRRGILSALLLAAAAFSVVGIAAAFEPRDDAAAAGIAVARRRRLKKKTYKQQFYRDVYIRVVTKLNGVQICFEQEAEETLEFLEAFHAAFVDVYGSSPKLGQLKIEEYSAEEVDQPNDKKQKGKNKVRHRELGRAYRRTRLRKRARLRITEDGGSTELVEDSTVLIRRLLQQLNSNGAAVEGGVGRRRLDARLSEALLSRLRENRDFRQVETAYVTFGLQANQTWDEMQQDDSAKVECRSVAEAMEHVDDVGDNATPPPPEGPSLHELIETATAENEQLSTEMDKETWKAERKRGKKGNKKL